MSGHLTFPSRFWLHESGLIQTRDGTLIYDDEVAASALSVSVEVVRADDVAELRAALDRAEHAQTGGPKA